MLSGFKNFILRGNLVDLAVAVIIGTAFGAVVTAFTAWITGHLPGGESTFKSVDLGDFGFFVNALISFLILAAVVYFLIVLPYTRFKERYFPSAPPGTPEDIQLLQEIRDLLAAQRGEGPAPGARRPRATASATRPPGRARPRWSREVCRRTPRRVGVGAPSPVPGPPPRRGRPGHSRAESGVGQVVGAGADAVRGLVRG
jgi:large conductance mechanosensitive channel